jgi:hypothetical protein
MTIIPKEQALERWEMLTDAVREALASEQNSDIVEQVCVAQHIPAEKIKLVSRVAGYVLMGFLHIEDAANEIKEALGVHPEIAAAIAKALTVKIFTPLRSELEKTYSPLPRASTKPAVPVLIQEIAPPPSTSPAFPALPAMGPLKKPAVFIGPGKSASAASPAPQPTRPSPFATPSSPAIAQDTPKSPFILHEETAPTKAEGLAGFHINISADKFGAAKPEAAPPLRANIEIGGAPPSRYGVSGYGADESKDKAAGVPATSAAASTPNKTDGQRVVHYGDLRTPIEPPERLSPPVIRPSAPENKESFFLNLSNLTMDKQPSITSKGPEPSKKPLAPQTVKTTAKETSGVPPPPPPPPKPKTPYSGAAKGAAQRESVIDLSALRKIDGKP